MIMSCTCILALVYANLYLQYRQRHMGIWTLAWGIYVLRLIAELWMASHPDSVFALICSQACMLLNSVVILWGAYEFSGKRTPAWLIYVAGLGTAWIVGAALLHVPFTPLTLPACTIQALAAVFTGMLFLRMQAGDPKNIGNRVAGWAFILWGLHRLDFPFLKQVAWFAPWGYLIGGFFSITAAVGVLLMYLQKSASDLAASEDLYRSLIELSPDAIVVVNKGKFIYANPKAAELLGAKHVSELIGKHVVFFISPDEREWVTANIRRVEQGGTSVHNQRLIQFNGDFIDVEVLASNVIYEGKPSVQAIWRDITGKQQAEEELHFKSLLLDNAVDSVFVSDLNGKLIYANKAAYETRGYSFEELMAMNMTDIDAPDDALELSKRFKNIRKTGSAIYELNHTKKDGSLLPVEVHARLLQYNGEDVIFGLVRDMTERKSVEAELRAAKERIELVYDVIPSAIFTVDAKGLVTTFNKKAEEITGFKAEEVIGKPCKTFALQPCATSCGLLSPKVKKPLNNRECTIRRKDGEIRTISKNLDVLSDSDGNMIGGVESFEDITERKQAMETLRESERRFRDMLENVNLVALMVDQKGNIAFCNDFFLNLTGWEWAEVIGRNWFDTFVPETNREAIRRQILDSITSEKSDISTQYDIMTRDGELRTISFSGSMLRSPGGDVIGIASIGEDITERRRAEERVNYLAYYDSLTDLPNRVLFNDRLSLAMAHAHRNEDLLGLMYLDLDSFKTINDTLGHAVGDQLLKLVAERLSKSMREGDTVARLGGDEFVMLLPQVGSADDLPKVAEKVIEALKPPFTVDGQELHITTSIGISVYPYDGKDIESLLKNAEVALYRAKEQGRDNYQLYTSAMNAKAFERLALENSLRKALEREEFAVYYQPQVDLLTGLVIGMEALIRWNHPDLGLIGPAQFIPLAEETGLITSIGEWVLRTSCKQTKAWQDKGYTNNRISVNLSARQFQQHDLVEMVDRVIQDSGLDPSYLELEITESVVMQDADQAIMILNQFKERGIKVAIDDFGTGYSSLSYLKQFPIDRIKIDRIFIHTIITDSDDMAITAAIIAMSHNLNVAAVAEGVETVEQLDVLTELECDEIQGFVFSRPVPADEAEKLFANPPQRLLNYWMDGEIQSA
jgi:diguanylate cyclase (GGDEF)-like protein/PAS domain S-box-containing protein